MWNLVGNRAVLRFLGRSLASGSLGHSYLLVGPPGVGKGTLARDLAQAVNCEGMGDPEAGPCGGCRPCRRIAGGNFADLMVLGVEEEEGRKEIPVERVREVLRAVALHPYEGRVRVVIVDGAESLSEESANTLLKVVEEPPPHTLFLLLTAEEERVPPTLRSRCQRLPLHPLSEEEVARALEERWGAPPERARALARLSRGSLGWAVRALQGPSFWEGRERLLERFARLLEAPLAERLEFAGEMASRLRGGRSTVREDLRTWALWWRDLLALRAGAEEALLHWEWRERMLPLASALSPRQICEAIRAVLEAGDLLEANVNPYLALEGLVLALPSIPGRRG